MPSGPITDASHLNNLLSRLLRFNTTVKKCFFTSLAISSREASLAFALVVPSFPGLTKPCAGLPENIYIVEMEIVKLPNQVA